MMYSRDYRDVVSGAAMAAFGLWFAWYASTHYSRGTAAQMGDGMFPIILGLAFAFLGVVIAISGLVKPGAKINFNFTTAFFVLIGVAGFALTVGPFGMAPAIVVLTVVSSFADYKKVRARGLFVLCVILCAMTYLIFRLGLGLAVPMIDWPF